MKILFNNLIKTAGVSAVTADQNFPASNLQSTFLRKRFQSVNLTDTVSVSFLSLTPINCIYYGYTNATVTVKLYDGVTLLDTLTGSTSYHFPSVSVDRVDFELSASSVAYLGGIGLGMEVSIDPPESFWDETFDDRSLVSESQSGQVLQEYVEPLRNYSFRVPTVTRDGLRAFQAIYTQYGIGHCVWVDPQTDNLPVLYSRLTEAISASKNKRQYALTLNFKEAR